MVLRADKSTYAVGEEVHFTLSAKNTSTTACMTQANECYDWVAVYDANGNAVWFSRPIGYGMCANSPKQIAPGAVITFTYPWDQQTCNTPGEPGCPGPPVPPGTYNANGYWGGIKSPSVSLTIA